MEKYIIGIDIGTTSVGYSVVRKQDLKVIRKGNKKLWGVRLFDEASTALETRNFRSTRRRYDRRRKRIKLLQKDFQEEINKVDSQFYQKLKESFFNEKDKTIPITKSEKNEIVKYMKEYPTIYHLRRKLVMEKEKMDIRLVYLAIHHIIKYRGNFLYEGSNFNANSLNISEKLEELFNSLSEIFGNYDLIDIIDYLELEKILLLENKNDRRFKLKEFLNSYFENSFVLEFIKAILGDKFSISKLFSIELEKDIKIDFKGSDYDDNFNELELVLEDKIAILSLMKELYDMIFLKKFFQGEKENTLSSLMVNKYKTHEEDLKLLKAIFKTNKKDYIYLFKSKDKPCLYEKYYKNHITYDEFTKKILALLNKDIQNDDINLLKQKIESGKFMPRITSTENGKFPYQLNRDELIMIIENQGEYYPFLKEKGVEKYKIVELLEFKIPYYVGPLNSTTDKEDKNRNCWVVKRENVAEITPYNFKKVIDIDASAEQFIMRMIGNCTYLLQEKVIPNHSILYSKFKVLNELKQIKVNGYKLSLELQKKIYDKFFLKTSGSLTDKKFKLFLKQLPEFKMYDELLITGYSSDNKFANNMQSYIDFFCDKGIFEGTSYMSEDADQIITWITVFEDKEILKRKVEQNYHLDDNKINLILKKNYKGWSNLSKKLITTNYCINKKENLTKSILDLMEETDQNFMQIINNKTYCFQKMIDELNGKVMTPKLNYDVVSNLVTSPATKKGIYQTLLLIEELVSIMGYEPDKIILEMARGKEKSGRTEDRKKYINKIFDACKQDIRDYRKLKSELNSIEKIDSQKLFLYFIQEGKSLYSGTPLDITHLEDYEIDHIIPRTLIKDDSIDNKALVLRQENQEKAANFVLPFNFRNDEMRKWWNHLKKIGLMSSKKYYNLCRSTYSKEDIEGFINRQLVETRQISKHVANIIQNYHKKTQVIYLSASLSHHYREKFELYKFREINNFHHAHDAYLAAVLGEYRSSYLKEDFDFEHLKEFHYRLWKSKKYKELSYGYVINSLDNEFIRYDENGEVIFHPEQFNKIVENTLYCNDVLISKKTEKKTGAFYKQTIHSRNEIGNKLPLKQNLDPNLYGGYKDVEIAYTLLVQYKNKCKLIGIPILIDKQAKKDKMFLLNYIKNHLGLNHLEDFEIIKNNIYLNTLLTYNEQEVYLKGYSVSKKSCEISNAVELKIQKDKMKEWKYTLNYVLNNKPIPEYKKTVLTDSKVEKQIDEIIAWLLDKKEYYPLYTNAISKIEDVLNKVELSFEEKKKVLKELFKLFGTSENANLSFIKDSNLKDRIGRLSGRNITNGRFIYKSVTGFKEKYYEF